MAGLEPAELAGDLYDCTTEPTVTGSGRYDSIFKGEHIQLQQNLLWIFDCRQRDSANPRLAWSHANFA